MSIESISKFKLTLGLKQLTPIIHFQHDQDGAILRATEVKPKLDRFILMYCQANNVKIKDSWYIDKSKSEAFNYKMNILISGEVNDKTLKRSNETDTKLIKERLIPNNQNPQISIKGSYFGNMVSLNSSMDDEEKTDLIRKTYKDYIFYTDKISINVNIICFKSDLLKIIEDNIVGFFLLNNFGTRQNKGYGSFKVISINGKSQINSINIMNTISKYEKDAWYIMGNKQYASSCETALEDIKLIYGFMKGGYNFTKTYNKVTGRMEASRTPKDYFRGFIYRYFNAKEIKNDKAFIKQVVLKDRFNNENKGERKTEGKEYRYVRAMLGLPELLDFRNIREKIYIYNKDIKRYASPILFKVIDDYIFIIPRKVNSTMLSKNFYLTTNRSEERYLKNSNEKERIATPKEFSLVEFLDAFRKDFNDKKTPKGGEIGIEKAESRSLERAKKLKIEKVGENK